MDIRNKLKDLENRINSLFYKLGKVQTEVENKPSGDVKVKYDAGDPTAGYVVDKFVAGEGITLAEGTEANENKLVITNTVESSAASYKVYTAVVTDYDGDSGNITMEILQNTIGEIVWTTNAGNGIYGSLTGAKVEGSAKAARGNDIASNWNPQGIIGRIDG
jgi:hypothetical protein